MKLSRHGKNTSTIDIHTSSGGIWLLLNGTEYFLSFKAFPWFLDAKVSALYHVELLHKTHLYWPELDVDLHLESLTHIEKYPLKYSA